MNYLEWIDQQITKHQTEIARLTVARGVIEEASEIVKPRQNAPQRRLLAKPTRRTTFTKGETRGFVLAAMKELGRPAMPKEITPLVLARNPAITEKMIWNTLYHLRLSGKAVRGDDGYALLLETQEKAA